MPLARGGRVYVGSPDGRLYAVEARTGALAWRLQAGGPITSSPALWGGIVFVGSDDEFLYALEEASGRQLWRVPAYGAVTTSPRVTHGLVLFAGLFDHYYAVDLERRTVRWTLRTDGAICSLARESTARPSTSARRRGGCRRLALSALVGLMFVPFSRAGGEATKRAGRAVIRPPGALAEPDFLAHCAKCGQCLRVCPTNVLQPAFFETGIEGFATPVLDNRVGYCELNCVLCGQVCETGAIERLTIERKLGLGEYEGRPVRLGTAFFDHGRCLPWSMDTACVVCEEVCPTSPKAIFTKPAAVVTRAGQTVTLRQPYVEPARCIGCGTCEHVCPVADVAGVRVTPIGETRAPDRALVLS